MTDQSVILMQIKDKPSEKEHAKRKLILEAARRLLVERGFQDVALDDVAKAAGVAKGTLFLYYDSKDALFSAAFADLVDQLGDLLDDLLKDLPASSLRGRALLTRTVAVILGHFEANRDFMSQFGAGRFPGCGDRSCGKLMEKMSRNVGRVVLILRRCAQDGLIQTKDFEASAAYLFGLCRSSILYKAFKGGHQPLPERGDSVVDMFLHGVGRR